MKPADQEPIAIEKSLFLTDPKRRGAPLGGVGASGEVAGPVRRQREEETVGKGLSCGFHGKASARRGSGVRTGWSE